MKYLALLLAPLLSCMPVTPRLPDMPNRSESIEKALNTVVALRSDRRGIFCSAVWVNSAYLVTAAHCVDDQEDHMIGLRQDWDPETNQFEVVYPVERVTIDEVGDVALLRWDDDGMPPQHRYVRLAWEDAQYGDEVWAIGHAYGLGWYFSTGEVVDPRRGDVPFAYPYTLHNAPTFPGMSGGPILTRSGRLLCITSFRAGASFSGCAHRETLARLLSAPLAQEEEEDQ